MSVYSSLSRCSFSLISPVLYCSSRTDLASSGCKHKERAQKITLQITWSVSDTWRGKRKTYRNFSTQGWLRQIIHTHPHPGGQIHNFPCVGSCTLIHLWTIVISSLHFKNPCVCFKVSSFVPPAFPGSAGFAEQVLSELQGYVLWKNRILSVQNAKGGCSSLTLLSFSLPRCHMPVQVQHPSGMPTCMSAAFPKPWPRKN